MPAYHMLLLLVNLLQPSCITDKHERAFLLHALYDSTFTTRATKLVVVTSQCVTVWLGRN